MKKFCIICGSTNLKEEIKSTQAGFTKYWYTCNKCHHFFVENHCGSCHEKIYKNGSFWTYHDTSPISPYNIKCPHCGEFAVPRIDGQS